MQLCSECQTMLMDVAVHVLAVQAWILPIVRQAHGPGLTTELELIVSSDR